MRILLIDDSDSVRTLTRIILERGGHEVVEADGGREGLLLYPVSGADVVVTDLFMPGTDGVEVICGIRRECPDARVIAVSGGGCDGGLDMLPMARMLGADAILDKPFKPAEMLAAVERVTRPAAV